ncbi:VWA domain-containing protein [Xylanibacillus composti]|uniref:VWFA domain-containing protein n=1 Tax=Xylanibacillus composti TaxID=1572762 RepID=A0A8J4H1L1_9BACL|nr:VWA domain-containing protein [Xylanibacillus composti]MDT9725822.1 VWA domain-containing protein [Xylanibacillus composti]GIQ69224.1 hypothetical protein XYCOK13_20480 [Xylanibacillus composti]
MKERRGVKFWSLLVCLTLVVSACSTGSSNQADNSGQGTKGGRNSGGSMQEATSADSNRANPQSRTDSAAQGQSASETSKQLYTYVPPSFDRLDDRRSQAEDMFFKEYGTHPFLSPEDDPYSTFAVDVDTGSYTIVRQYLRDGLLPPKEAVRLEEIINYFDLDYEAPEEEAFAIHVDGGDSPFSDHYKLLRIGLKGREIAADQRKQANLTFVIDISGSMDRDNRLELVKRSLRLLVDQLNEDDKIGIVTYGSKAEEVLHLTRVKNKERILEAIDSLAPSGSTNVEAGLELGYRMANDQLDEGEINRVILCSDGVANVGETEPDALLKSIREHAKEGITLTTLGFGMGNYNDTLMEQLANNGNGSYAYIDSFGEARRLFTDQLAGTLETIAMDAKVQVEFNPDRVDRYRLLGYENRDLADEDFRNDSVDAGEVGAGHAVTALYEVRLKDGQEQQSFGTVRLRYEDVRNGAVQELEAPLRIGASLKRETALLAAAAEYAEILRGSYWAQDGDLAAVLEVAERSANGGSQEELVGMIKDTLALSRP